MAIGTAAAIGLGLAGAGSIIGGSSNKKAATTAANAQTQMAAQNNALAANIYGQNRQALTPYMERGNAAGGQVNALLGLAGGNSQAAAGQAFDMFRNSTGYQFRVGQGQDALNSGYAGSGLLRSGAALKGLDDYRQGMASQEFGNYMGYLTNQQGVGLSGASALAGVGQNYTNNVSVNNAQAADAIGNAALIKGANNPLAGLLGMVGGAAFGMGR